METEPRLNVVLSLHDGTVLPWDGVPLSVITHLIGVYATGGAMTIRGENEGAFAEYGPGDVTGLAISRTPWWANSEQFG